MLKIHKTVRKEKARREIEEASALGINIKTGGSRTSNIIVDLDRSNTHRPELPIGVLRCMLDDRWYTENRLYITPNTLRVLDDPPNFVAAVNRYLAASSLAASSSN